MKSMLAILLATHLVTPALAAESVATVGERACTSGESWKFSSTFPADYAETYRAFLSTKIRPVQGFSEGLAIRRFSKTDEGKAFGEYWISRALFDAKLYHIAQNGFAALAARELSPETAGVQLAALNCLIEIHHKVPSLTLPAAAGAHIADFIPFALSAANRETLWLAADQHVLNLVAEGKVSAKSMEKTLSILKGGGTYEFFGRGVAASHENDYEEVIQNIDLYLRDPSLPKPLKRYTDTGHILLARAYYGLGNYDQAATHFKWVTKSSNELANSLSELSWSYLMNEKFAEAIGTGMNLQAGGFRHTFAPEAPMVMAMALNELCQFPESIRSINAFRKNYEKPFRWLSAWKNKEPETQTKGLYAQALDYLKKRGNVPERVSSEWVRSSLFLSTQDEINLLFDEKDSAVLLGKAGAKEQRRLGDDLLKLARDLKPKLRRAKMKMKEGDALPRSIVADLEKLRDQMNHYRRLQQAAPVWRMVLNNHQRLAPTIEKKLVARINEDLSLRSLRMYRQIEEIAENVQLIEVEIFNGASQDIIWQNAHPDYKAMAQQMKNENQKVVAEKTWNWGRIPAAEGEEDTEVWEDELGSFKANLYDNCSSKERFLAIKRVGGRGGKR